MGDRVESMGRMGRRGRGALVAAFSVAAAVLASSSGAHGYVRYKIAGSGIPFAWKTSCVRVVAIPADIPNLTSLQTSDAIAAAVAAWSNQDPMLAACSYLDLGLTVDQGAVLPPAQNRAGNFVGFRQDSWCPGGAPQVCYDPTALAITSVFARTSTGEILSGEVEINAVNFSWADLAAGDAGDGRDLQAAVTHEVGHLIGFDHTCYTAAPASIPTDQNGDPIPDCASAPAAVLETTMFPTAATDTGPRTLAPDDQQAVCDSYPIASDPMSCFTSTPTDGGVDAAQMDAAAPMDATSDVGSGTLDAGADAGTAEHAKSGCGCEIQPTEVWGSSWPALVVLLVIARGRGRRRPRQNEP